MADIFVSYASEDRARVEPLVRLLQSAGFSVWWDRQLQGGTFFAKEIEDEALKAAVVLVLWTRASIASPWVTDEAELGRNAAKLIPLAFDGVRQPIGFRQVQTIDFSGWDGGESGEAFTSLRQAINRVLTESAPEVSAQRAGAPAASAHQEFSPPQASIAVLPFVNMSADPEQGYFSDGISEELLNLLAKIKETHVAARTSSFKFKGQDLDIRAIGLALNVAHVLEGSVRKAGNRVRITAQLIKTTTGFHMWSETYDRKLDDIFQIQDEISAAIVLALRDFILEGVEAPQAVRSQSIKAYDLFLLGQDRLNTRSAKEFERGQQFFKEALALDGDYAPALAGLALTHLLLSDGFGSLGKIPLEEARTAALPLIEKAITADGASVEGHIALAYYHQLGRNPKGAIASAERALEINPNDTRAWSILSAAHAQSGDPRVMSATYRKKIHELDPLSLGGMRTMAHHYYSRHRFAQAREMVDKMAVIAPTSPEVTIRRIWFSLNEGEYAAALGRAIEAGSQWPLVTVKRAVLPTLILLGEGRVVEHWDPTFALLYYMQAGFHEDAGRMAKIVEAMPDLAGDYRLSLDLALWRTLEGRYGEAANLLAPFDEPDQGAWGLHYHLTYGLLGAQMAVYLRQKLGDLDGAEVYLGKLRIVHEALRDDPEGIHLGTHKIGAFIALADGDTDGALRLLEAQADYSLYEAADIASLPFFAALKDEPRHQAVVARIRGHGALQRKKAQEAGYLSLSESLLKAE